MGPARRLGQRSRCHPCTPRTGPLVFTFLRSHRSCRDRVDLEYHDTSAPSDLAEKSPERHAACTLARIDPLDQSPHVSRCTRPTLSAASTRTFRSLLEDYNLTNSASSSQLADHTVPHYNRFRGFMSMHLLPLDQLSPPPNNLAHDTTC